MSDSTESPNAQPVAAHRIAEAHADTTPQQINNDVLETLLDAIDDRTNYQQLLHDRLADGFLALARERYRNPSSLQRLGRLVHDNRQDLRSNLRLQIQPQTAGDSHEPLVLTHYDPQNAAAQKTLSTSLPTLRKRHTALKENDAPPTGRRGGKRPQPHVDVRNNMMAMPSAEVREAMSSFRDALEACIEVANATGRVEQLLDGVIRG